MPDISVHLTITGRVQGVAFRAWTKDQATRLGLSGWVRNRPDGSVQAYVTGPSDTVDQLVAALHQGPPAARVTGVTSERVDGAEAMEGFEVR